MVKLKADPIITNLSGKPNNHRNHSMLMGNVYQSLLPLVTSDTLYRLLGPPLLALAI